MRELAIVLLCLASCDVPGRARGSGFAEVELEASPVPDPDVGVAARVARDPPPGFVSVSEAVPGAVLEVRYATPDNFTGAPLPGYVPGVLWLHEDVAAALARVQANVAEDGLRLRVYDAYRPARASVAMVEWTRARGRSSLITDGYVAARSNHARGNTVDLTLDGPDGTPLPMGTDWDAFTTDSHYANARGDAMRNRTRLRQAMRRAGFVPYAREWWHFSLPSDHPRLDVPYAPK